MSSLPSEIFTQIKNCIDNRFTGKLNIIGSNIQSWSIYFYSGKIIGDSGGSHPIRRLHRQIARYCPNLSSELEVFHDNNIVDDNIFSSTKNLFRRRKISYEQALKIIESSTSESLFDIVYEARQLKERDKLHLRFITAPESLDAAELPIVWLNFDNLWREVEERWKAWCDKNLYNYSPNLAPRIDDRDRLQQLTSPSTYDKLTKLIDGKLTLRDVSITLDRELSSLTYSFVGYCQQGLMSLVAVSDLNFNNNSAATIEPSPSVVPKLPSTPKVTATSSTKAPLVAHIDDNSLDIQIMGQILKQTGYRYVNVQNPTLALASLLKERPDLIFLDLVMPVANGYEICAQFRRVSAFQETPIIILTGNDGIVDRVRAKMVNSTAFMSKPIEKDKVLAILQKYLPSAIATIASA